MVATRNRKYANAMTIIIPEWVYVRTQSHADWDAETGCIVSRYSIRDHGYAQIGWELNGRRTVTLAHRVAWAYTYGTIPEGMTVDHRCRNRRCVNVAHMRLLSNYENARRTGGRDWQLGQCVNGHPNSRLRRQPAGKRVCIDCKKSWTARYEAKKRGADA